MVLPEYDLRHENISWAAQKRDFNKTSISPGSDVLLVARVVHLLHIEQPT